MSWILANWEWLGGISVLSVGIFVFRYIVFHKPKIVIEEEMTIDFDPNRTVWQVSVYNEKLKGLLQFCKRNELNCWIEADFIVGAEIPSINDRAAVAFWGCTPPNYLNLKPDSNRYNIELINKIRGESGFHIQRPTPDTLMVAEDVLAIVTVRTAKDEIVAKAIYAIYDKGKHVIGINNDLDFERLE